MHKTQRQRLKELFESRPNQEIPLNEIADLRIMQYGRVIMELRNGDIQNDVPRMDIKNRTKFIDGVNHSWFKYIPSSRATQGDFYTSPLMGAKKDLLSVVR